MSVSFRLFVVAAALLFALLPTLAHAQIWQRAGGEDLQVAAQALRPGQYIWSDRQNVRAGLGDGESAVSLPVRLIVSLPAQKLYVYRGEELVGAASVSTGARGKSTPQGTFPILQKARFHRSNIYSNAPMPFMQRLTWTGIALHAGHNPGHPASHGCIRLPLAFARDLYALTRLGTEVAVTDEHLPSQLAPTPHWLPVDQWVWADWRTEDELSYAPTAESAPTGWGETHWYARDEIATIRLDYAPTILFYEGPWRRR